MKVKNLDVIVWSVICIVVGVVGVVGLSKIAPLDQLINWAIATNNQFIGATILFIGLHVFAISIMFVCAFLIGQFFNHRKA